MNQGKEDFSTTIVNREANEAATTHERKGKFFKKYFV